MAQNEKTRAKLLTHFKTEENLQRAVADCDIPAFREACGCSEKKASELIASMQGIYCDGFLAGEKSGLIHETVLDMISGYAHTGYAKNRVRMLLPLKGMKEISARLGDCLAAKDRVAGLPRDAIEKLLLALTRTRVPSPKFNGSVVILIESEGEYETVSKTDIPRHCRTVPASDPSGLEEAEVIIYVSSEGRLDLTRQENVVLVPSGARDFEMVPELVTDFFSVNADLIRTVADLRALLGQESLCATVGPVLDRIKGKQVDLRGYEKAVMTVRDEMNAELKKHAGELSLTGDELLEVLGRGVPRKLREVYSRVQVGARARLKSLTGYDHTPYEMKYPIEIDDDELEKVRRRILAESGTSLFEEKVRAARKLRDLREKVECEIREALEFDYEYCIGAFSCDFDLKMPRFGKEFRLEGASHLGLARSGSVQKVDYDFGGSENAILLTGANSGGKTTLLETIAQIVIMARCGLPVCARGAVIELPEELYFFGAQRNLNAGAFESFLRTLVPAVMGKTKRLILADELEAMTELEAGARIVAAMIERLKTSNSGIIVVTHMAREISKYTTVRIDGIEAQGLDADYNLVVDRTPKQNYLARSTPELILRRLAETADGDEKKVYKELLDKVKG